MANQYLEALERLAFETGLRNEPLMLEFKRRETERLAQLSLDNQMASPAHPECMNSRTHDWSGRSGFGA